MASNQELEEVAVQKEKVSPGWTFNISSREYYPSDSASKVENETSLKFFVNIESGIYLKGLQQRVKPSNLPWLDDLGKQNGKNACLIKGTRRLEIRGSNTSPHKTRHTVISVNFFIQAHMLLIFSQELNVQDKKSIESSLMDALYKGSELDIPQSSSRNFVSAFLYKDKSKGEQMSTFKISMNRFVNFLKKCKFSDAPQTAFVMKPNPIVLHKTLAGNGCITDNCICPHENNDVKEELELQNVRDEAEKINCQQRSLNEMNVNVQDCTGSPEQQPQMQAHLDPQQPPSNTLQVSSHLTDNVQELKSHSTAESYSHSGHSSHIGISGKSFNAHKPSESEINSSLTEDCELGMKGVQQSDTQNITERLLEKCGRALDNKLVEYSLQPEHPLPAKSEKHCNKDHVFGKETTTSKTNPCTQVTNVNKSSKVSKEETRQRQNCNTKSVTSETSNGQKVHQEIKDRHQESRETHKNKEKENSGFLSKKQKVDSSQLTQGREINSTSAKHGNEHKIPKHNTRKHDEKVMTFHTVQPSNLTSGPFGMKRIYFGADSNNAKEKVIILIGTSGSGKTTLINFIANCIKGVKTADEELIFVKVNSNCAPDYTTSTNAYTFCFMEDDIPITIIDTPGLCGSSDADVSNNIQALKTFITNVASKGLDIHAIGFVAQAYQACLTPTERLIIDYVFTLFGQGVADHLIPFITFADNQVVPPVIESMKNYGIRSKAALNFNNPVIGRNPNREINEMENAYWRIGSKSWKKCIKFMLELPPLSINTFKTVQSEVYATTVMDSAVRDLKAELKIFIDSCKDSKHMTKEAFKSCEQVWDLGAVVHHLKRSQESNVLDVERTVKIYAEEVCRENTFPVNDCVKLLSLAPSKGLLGAGMAIIYTVGPLYEQAKKFPKLKETATKKTPGFLYCKCCKAVHEIERKVFEGIISIIPGLGMSKDIIAYKCKHCKCDSSQHVTAFEKNTQTSVDLPFKYMLNNTEKAINDILKEHGRSGQQISKNQYLHHVNVALNCKYQVLIDDLVNNK